MEFRVHTVWNLIFSTIQLSDRTLGAQKLLFVVIDEISALLQSFVNRSHELILKWHFIGRHIERSVKIVQVN